MSNIDEMLKQVKRIKNGIGVQAILDEAYKILGNPIAMNNTEYALIAYTPVETDDPIWRELIELGTFGEITQKFFEKAGFVEEVANNRIAYLTTPYLKYDRINGKLLSKKNTHISNLITVACNKPFEEGDQMIFDIICKLVSKEIGESEEFYHYEQLHQELLIKNLIDGKYDIKADVAQMAILYDSLGHRLYVAAADISYSNLENTAICIDMLKKAKSEYKYAVYSGKIVIIISTNNEDLNVGKELKEFVKFLEQNNIYAGLSGKFENLFELKRHYEDAVKSLEYVVQCRCSQRIFPYNPESLEAIQQINELENGLGIQYLLDKAPEIFGNPVLFHDMELNLLGYSQNMEIIDPIWEELITYGTGSNEMIELFRVENFTVIMDSTKGGALLVSNKIKYDRISWRIYNSDDVRIGCTSIVNTDKQFSEDELILFGVFSIKFCKEVGKIGFYNDYGRIYSETIINRMLSGKIDDYTLLSGDAGNLYNNLMANLYLVVIDTTGCDSKNLNISYFRDLFNWPGTVNRYAIYSNYIIIIISTESELLSENENINEINKAFEKSNIYAGISSRFDDIYDVQKHYAATVELLNAGIENGDKERRIFWYNDKK